MKLFILLTFQAQVQSSHHPLRPSSACDFDHRSQNSSRAPPSVLRPSQHLEAQWRDAFAHEKLHVGAQSFRFQKHAAVCRRFMVLAAAMMASVRRPPTTSHAATQKAGATVSRAEKTYKLPRGVLLVRMRWRLAPISASSLSMAAEMEGGDYCQIKKMNVLVVMSWVKERAAMAECRGESGRRKAEGTTHKRCFDVGRELETGTQ